MVTIKTALQGLWGQKLKISAGEIHFDEKGFAEVEESVANHLISSSPDCYALGTEPTPTPNSGTYKNPNEDKEVLEFAQNHSAQKTAERQGAAPQVVTSTAAAQQQNSGKVLDHTGAAVKPEPAPIVQTPTPDQKTKEMLEQLSVSDIHETLEQAGLLDEATKQILDKETLIPVAVAKLG